MRGLLRNNFYTALPNVKVFTGIAVLLGAFVVAMDNAVPSLIIGYALLVIIGFSLISIASVRKESAAKWGKYKLTTPVKRADIALSFFVSQLLWLFVGIGFAGFGIAMSIGLHGYPFDRSTDVFMLLVVGTGISLFMGAIFFPLYFLGGEERSEVMMVVSLLGGIGMMNRVYSGNMTSRQIILSGIFITACSAAAFAASFPVTAGVFRKKEY